MAGRRAFVAFAQERKLSARQACTLLRVSRRRLGYASRKTGKDAALVDRLKDLAAAYPRYGYRMLWAKLGQAGVAVNLKRVRRLCRKHGLSLKVRRRRKRRGIGCGLPCKAEYPHQVWAYDFVEDRTENGRKLRVLTVEDEFTRLCLEIEVEYRMSAKYVGQVLLRLFGQYGTPAYIRSDNGPEFVAKHLMVLFASHGITARHIKPGNPWQNGINERFNGSYRDECANLHTFHNRDHARALSKLYRKEYNERRPHSSLGYRTPAEYAAACGVSGGRNKEAQRGSGALPPNPRDLAPCAPPVGLEKEGGASGEAHPGQPFGAPPGAPVASPQSRILPADQSRIVRNKRIGKFLVQGR